MSKFNGSFNAFCLKKEGASVLFASYKPGENIPAHNHDTYNCGIITKGEMILEIENVEKRYGIGDWFVIPVKILHSARFEVETEAVEFNFSNFHDEFGGQYG